MLGLGEYLFEPRNNRVVLGAREARLGRKRLGPIGIQPGNLPPRPRAEILSSGLRAHHELHVLLEHEVPLQIHA